MHTWKSEVQMQKSTALFGMVSHQTDLTDMTFSMFSSKADICPKRVSADGCEPNPASIQMRCGSEDLKLHAHHTSKLHCFAMSPGEGMYRRRFCARISQQVQFVDIFIAIFKTKFDILQCNVGSKLEAFPESTFYILI